MSYYDDDGNEVEGVLTPEEVNELKNKMTELETVAARAEELEAELKEKEGRLKSLESKEFNFNQLRGKTVEEKEELLKGFSEKEKTMMLEIGNLKSQIEENEAQTIKSYESDVLEALAGSDEDLKVKIKEMSKEFVGDVKTKEDVLLRYKRAFTLIKESFPQINPVNQFMPSSSSQIPSPKKQDYTKTPEGEANFKGWFPKLAK